eukprot:m.96638 g.96638  ORF g.96638 m.96638 type:complete len:59 (-) comp14801_c1_seq6:237-413(-)
MPVPTAKRLQEATSLAKGDGSYMQLGMTMQSFHCVLYISAFLLSIQKQQQTTKKMNQS